MSLAAFLALQKERIQRLGRSTPHATGPRRPGLVEQDAPTEAVEKDDE
jgi:hypothetical protein